jgi:hypothetical protein
LVVAVVWSWSSARGRVIDRSTALSAEVDQAHAGTLGTMPVVLLSTEPMVAAPAAEAEVPIVFPGYVLPDDTFEEPAHEGS